MQQTPTPSAKGPLKRYREEETPSMSHSPDSTTGGSAKKKRHRLKKKEAKEAQTNKPQQKPPNSVATASRLATPNVDEDDGDTSDESSSPASLQMFVDYEREQAVKKAGPKPVEVSVRTDKGKQKETLKELSTEDSDDDDFYVPSPEEVERVNLSKRDYRDRKHASGWFIPDKDEAAQIFYDSHMGPYWSLSRKDFVGETKITIQAQTAQQNARNKELKAFVHILGYEPLVKRREIVEQAVNNLLPAAVGKYRLSIIQKQSVWGLLEFDEEEHAKFFQTTLVALNKSSYCGVAFKELRNAPYKQRLIKAKNANTKGSTEEAVRTAVEGTLTKILGLEESVVGEKVKKRNTEAADSQDWHFPVKLSSKDAAKNWETKRNIWSKAQGTAGQVSFLLASPDYCKMCHGNGHEDNACWYSSKDFLEMHGYNLNPHASYKEKAARKQS